MLVGPAAAAAGESAPAGKINLNGATAEQLTAIPRVGPKLPSASSSIGSFQ
jgi:DNA uptake protein ComE-like DNA-binding protein